MTRSSWPVGSTSRRTTVNGQEVHYLEFDGPRSSPTVVCVHGLGGSALNFGALGPLLTSRHRVLALDLPGHGRSEAGAAPHRHGDIVEQLVTVVDQFLLEAAKGPVILVGHSLGGVISVLLAQRSPATVGRLALLAPPVPHRTRLPLDLRMSMRLGLLRAPGVRHVVDRQLALNSPDDLVHRQLTDATPHVSRVPPEAVIASVAEAAERIASADAVAARRLQWDAILGTMSILKRASEWSARLSVIDQPTIWLHGHDDRLVPVADATALVTTRPDWTFRTREGVGHLPHLEDASWVSDNLLTWLSGTAAPGVATRSRHREV